MEKKDVVGQGGNARHQHLSPFPSKFLKGSFYKVIQSRDFGLKD